jgi:hypothetical protein
LVVHVLFADRFCIFLAVLTAVDVNLTVDALVVFGFEETFFNWAFGDAVGRVYIFSEDWHLCVALDTLSLVDAF